MTKCWTLFSYFLRYYAHFKFDMAPLFVLLKGNQLLMIWVQIHHNQKVGYFVKSRSNLVIFRKSDWKYLYFWCEMMNFGGGVNFLLLLTIGQLNQSLIIKGHFSHFESWHTKFVHSTFDYDKLHWILHSLNLGI